MMTLRNWCLTCGDWASYEWSTCVYLHRWTGPRVDPPKARGTPPNDAIKAARHAASSAPEGRKR